MPMLAMLALQGKRLTSC